MRQCSITNCTFEIKRFRMGMCGRHYDRLRRKGSPYAESEKDRIPYIERENYILIAIGTNAKNGYAKVDKEFAYLNQYKWRNSDGYAARHIGNKDIRMHHEIIGKPPIGLQTDHINRDRLDNRVSNLRHVTPHINALNRGKDSRNKSGYRGVRVMSYGKFYVTINVNHQSIKLGSYDTFEEAKKARIKAEKQYGFGKP